DVRRPRDLGRKVRVAAVYHSDRKDHLIDIRPLHEIADGPRPERIDELLTLAISAHDNHPDSRMAFHNLAGSFDPVEPGHVDVHKDNIWLKLVCEQHCFVSVSSFADNRDLKMGFKE